MTVEMVHSCCPGKVDINAPVFKFKGVMATGRADLQEWECEGCHTIVYIIIKK